MNTALAWIMYDIAENKPRTQIAKLYKKYGLTRVRKSIFLAQNISGNLIVSFKS